MLSTTKFANHKIQDNTFRQFNTIHSNSLKLNNDQNPFFFRVLKPNEFPILEAWAEKEGWNPGKHEIGMLKNCQLFSCEGVFLNNKLIASIIITHHSDDFKFLGYFIVEPHFRGKRIGHYLVKKIIEGLANSSLLGINALQNKVSNYANLYQFTPTSEIISRWCIDISTINWNELNKKRQLTITNEVALDQLMSYDASLCSYSRETFLFEWINMPESYLLVGKIAGKVCGYGLMSKCYHGYKIAPLCANNIEIAHSLIEAFLTLAHQMNAASIQLDIPELNKEAKYLISKLGFKENFKTTRMFRGGQSNLNTMLKNEKLNKIFAYTSLEFG